jgi:hypothetical protein
MVVVALGHPKEEEEIDDSYPRGVPKADGSIWDVGSYYPPQP